MKFSSAAFQSAAAIFSLLTRSTFARAQETVASEPAGAPAHQPPQSLEEMAMQQVDTVKNLINMITEFLVKYSFQVLGGIIVLVLGWMVARFIGNWLLKFLGKKQIDVTVSKFIVGAVKLIILAFAFIVALGKFGIEIAPLIAGISVVGFGTSFALQGPLSNYAAGISLIFSKPFTVGQIIEVAGVMGEVIDIKIPKTELKTVDGTMITVPNKDIVGEIIHNYSTYKKLDITVGVSYKSDVEKALKVVNDIVTHEGRVTKDVRPKVGISQFADSSINIYARLWCKQDHYWDVLFDVNKKIFAEFARTGIEIPFPQRDVHIISQT
jgi:small conductance mechanosensitive channel